MNELIDQLSTGKHSLITQRCQSATELKECIDNEFVLIKFTGTRGGTELGIKLDLDRTELGDADFSASTGKVQLVGELSLNYQKIRLHAQLELANLQGEGYLEVL